MKILVDCHCFDGESTEGINTYLRGVYTHLTPMMPEVDFYFAAIDTDRLRHAFGNAPNVHYVALGSHGRVGRMLFEYPRLVRKLGIDVAHFQYFAPPYTGCRTLVTLHDLLFKDFPENFPPIYRLTRDCMFRHSAHKADVVATVSEYSRERISKHYGLDRKSILLTPNGVGRDFFDVDRVEARKFADSRGVRRYILNVSRVEPRKNLLALLEAYDRLQLASRGYDLVLINQPTLPVPEFEQYYRDMPENVSRHVHRTVAVSNKDLMMWYGGADLFVYPSLAEGFGIPPIEAAAIGIPTLCHNSTAMAAFDFLGENLTDLSTVTNLMNAIKRNLDNPPSEAELADIRDKIRNRFNWKSAAETLRFAFLGFL